MLRDRPIGADPLAGDWKLEDAKTEIRQAKAAGIDGWTLDILNLNGTTWDTVVRMVDAADAVGGFKIILNPDMNSSAGSADSGTIADKIVSLARRPSIYRHRIRGLRARRLQGRGQAGRLVAGADGRHHRQDPGCGSASSPPC